jgi:hypothetical protein
MVEVLPKAPAPNGAKIIPAMMRLFVAAGAALSLGQWTDPRAQDLLRQAHRELAAVIEIGGLE